MLKNKLFLFLFLIHFFTFSQDNISFISWNIRDFGKTKNTEELDRIADIVRDVDIVALQEVVAGPGGAQAVAHLADILNRKGSKWDYVVSNPTKSPKYATERYAFLWKTSRIKVEKRGNLISELDSLVDREPFFIDFYKNGRKLSVINFHSRPHDKNPESEIAAITDYLKKSYRQTPLLLVGDFNVDEKKPVFDNLKNMGFRTAVSNQRTTLKLSCDKNNYLNYAIDNIFYSHDILKLQGSASDFVMLCENLTNARMLSDHLPVFFEFSF